MLFHITQTHSHQNCPAHDPDAMATIKKWFQSAGEFGIKLAAAHADTPGHAGFYVVDTNSVDDLQNWIDPILPYFNHEIRPVSDVLSVVERLQEESRMH